MNKEEYQKLMSDMSEESKVPCLHCPLKVNRCDMPRVGVCKICYVRLKKENPSQAEGLGTWDKFLKLKS